ncbi:MAG: lysophospholipid acyltransferase family protein [Bryobacteraceae bacterium]|nr:lysophospholipid acyltransferase family protein [Bryobacteraceae bacterium]MDW8378389.1 lysophospholipid acyltransferase family protein [Bryobacterales bacterium]
MRSPNSPPGLDSSHRPRRSAARNWAEYILARACLALAGLLPFPLACHFGTAVIALLVASSAKLRHTAMRNLELAFPELPRAKRKQILQGMCLSLGRMLALIARMHRLTPSTISRYIRYDGLHHFQNAQKQGRGVLFFTAHLGNWELSAFAHGLLTAPMHIVVRPLDNPLLDAYLCRLRARSGNRIISKRESARSILKALQSNQAVGILADQNASAAEGVFITFFGLRACAHAGFARLAARSGASVIPGFALWSEEEGRWILRFYPPVTVTGDTASDTQRLHSQLEQIIRQYPDQWLWIHRRWKTRPPGEPPLYEMSSSNERPARDNRAS